MVTTIVIIAVIAVLVLWVISVQNKLVKLDELSNNALKQINVQQVSRFDALKALAKLTKDYAAYESEQIEKMFAARNMSSSARPTVAEINGNEAALAGIASRLIAVAEQYPELKASDNYAKTMSSVKEYEENVRLSRMTFNDTVTKFNQQVRMFPGSLVAGPLGFAPKEYLAEDKSKTEYPEL